jgi:hypothetical protein
MGMKRGWIGSFWEVISRADLGACLWAKRGWIGGLWGGNFEGRFGAVYGGFCK